MRILVLSDSHGAVEACRLAVEQSAPDQILHLGDCVRDAERLHALFPAIPLTGVPGNCDWADADNPERLIELGGVRILMMHGHTHRPLVDWDGTLWVMNPGSIRDRRTYGVITLEGGKIDCAAQTLTL